MIQFVFTVDYEIYGNGQGSLKDLVYEPAEKLKAIFLKHGARFVVFPDAAELEMIESLGTDPDIGTVKGQLNDLRRKGFELGLHIHPWWYKARRDAERWILDGSEYNLCVLPRERIVEIVDRAIEYLRRVLTEPDFAPVSFRAGHLLFQPTRPLAGVLAERGIKVDTSVYRGGLWRKQGLDYRRAPRTAPFWRFGDEAVVPDPRGVLIEVPIHTRQVPSWRLLTSKRVALQQAGGSAAKLRLKILDRFSDFARLRYPLKLDFGQMTGHEASRTIDRIIREDRTDPASYRPVVAILHTKDPLDAETLDATLETLARNGIGVTTLEGVHRRIETLPPGSGGTGQ